MDLGSHPERKGLCLVGCRIACLGINLIFATSKSAWFELEYLFIVWYILPTCYILA
jgi:hypothetical protein